YRCFVAASARSARSLASRLRLNSLSTFRFRFTPNSPSIVYIVAAQPKVEDKAEKPGDPKERSMDDVATIFSLNNWPGHLSYVLIAISYWLTDIFWLRVTAVVGLSLEILYFL